MGEGAIWLTQVRDARIKGHCFSFFILERYVPIEFEWDESKAASNLRKHGLGFELAYRLFLEASCIEFDVSRNADGEARFKRVGAYRDKFVTIVFTRRAAIVRMHCPACWSHAKSRLGSMPFSSRLFSA
jgi:uncharacterized DUF497 family protein